MDTVIIKITGLKKFNIKNLSWFVPELSRRDYYALSPTEQKSTAPYLRKFLFRPHWQSEYLPKVELFENLSKTCRDIEYVLKIEFSVPKLLYGNSLQEVAEKDMKKILTKLKDRLLSVGIGTSEEILADARVSAVHFCKNIPLPQGMAMKELLKELARVDINKVVDVTSTQFKSGGQVLNVYSGTIERSFYDKISDALRPKNKRSDKKRIDQERAVIERYGLEKREVFRYEYRIKKTQTVLREINKALGRAPKTFVAFKELFTDGLFKKMVVGSWRELVQRPENQLALLGSTDISGLLPHILGKAKDAKSSGHSMNKALISYGLARATGDHGVKELRRQIFSKWHKDHSERFNKKLKIA